MQIKSIVAGAAIALIAGVGSVSADKLHVADTAGDTGAPFASLNGVATSQMSVKDMAATRGGYRVVINHEEIFSSASTGSRACDPVCTSRASSWILFFDGSAIE